MKNLFMASIAVLIMIACSGNQQKPQGIMGKITALPELKIAERKIDSLNKIGMPAEIEIMILPESFHPEDSAKNISIAFIQGSYGFDEAIFYEIRFDKKTEEIISVEKK